MRSLLVTVSIITLSLYLFMTVYLMQNFIQILSIANYAPVIVS